MINEDNQLEQAGEPRWLVEEMVREGMDQSPDMFDAPVPEEIRLMFYELSMHQIELETQNEELRRTQGRLDSEREHYFDLYELAPVGYCTLSDQGLILEANLTVAVLLEIPRETLIKQPLSRFIHKDDQDAYSLHCKADAAGLRACELRMRKEDGTVFWAHLTTATPQIADGTFESRLVITDITARKQAEEALRQSEQKAKDAQKMLQLVLDTIPVRLFWKDVNSVFLGCNRLFAEDAGYQDPEEVIGADDYSMVWREQAEMYRRDDAAVMRSGKPKLHYEELQTAPDGKQIWLSTSKVPLRDTADRTIGILGTYENITRRKLAEKELPKNQQLDFLGRLANGIAHDFNNILMVIMGNISFAKMLLAPTDKAYERLEIAETAAFKAKNLTRQFLTFSKGGVPVKCSIPAANLIKSYSRLALSGTQSTCEYTIPADLWNIDADEGQIGQALANILINADQSMQEGGAISINCENTVIGDEHNLPLNNGDYVKISITDQGNGILEEYLPKVFDPYFTTKEAGRGLGLASAYSIVKKHEGHLAVESIAGAGATFSLFVPASASQSPTPPAEESKILSGQGRILVMDDDEVILQIIGNMLENLGYDVTFAFDGREAVTKYAQAQLAAEPFDTVILDLIVPGGMGGKEAIQKLLAIDPQAKVIISSGYCNDPVLSEYKTYGFRGVIAKPYQVAELSQQIQQVLRN